MPPEVTKLCGWRGFTFYSLPRVSNSLVSPWGRRWHALMRVVSCRS